jgi:hypothetical protein
MPPKMHQRGAVVLWMECRDDMSRDAVWSENNHTNTIIYNTGN